MREIIELDMSKCPKLDTNADLYEMRSQRANYDVRDCSSEVSIFVLGYKNLEKTKACVESIFKYTKDIDFDLWLIDNGSPDETFEYYKTIEYDKLHILHLTEGRGIGIPEMNLSVNMLAKYFVYIMNDLVLTPNWLSNMLTVAKSDPKIGIVHPMSSNVSNRQLIDFQFKNDEEMQEIAAKHNISDPKKWEERIRIMTLATLYTKECMLAIGMPLYDVGFFHNFLDDDVVFKARRAGYKAVLAGDTWVHHNDDKLLLSEEERKNFISEINFGRKLFKEKYLGIDAWDDVNNFIPEILYNLKPSKTAEEVKILGIDVRCGTPILELKNGYRRQNIFKASCYAYTTEGKYMIDLQTVCGAEKVFSGPIEGFQDDFEENSFDSIVIERDINTFNDPFRVIKGAYGLLKKDGQLFISLKNTQDLFSLLEMLGRHIKKVDNVALNYKIEDFLGCLANRKYNYKFIGTRLYNENVLGNDLKGIAEKILKLTGAPNIDETFCRLCSDRFFILITK